MADVSLQLSEQDGSESDVQTLYYKVKKLLLSYPLAPRWSPSYETMNELQIKSETSFGVINQYEILLNKNVFAKCRSNLDDESIISDLDYNRSLKSSLRKQYDESLLSQSHSATETNIAKYVLQDLIHTLQHSDIVPFYNHNARSKQHILQITKCVGISTSDAHKFNDREYFWGDYDDNRRIVQIQVCFDKHVHGLQVKWLVNNNSIYSGSQHFSSRFSGKNIDTLVLSHNEYICCVTGTCSQWIDSLVIHTNFGRVKSFGSTNEGQSFDLEIPQNCQVLGFCGSYSSQLYTLGALYRAITIKESKEIMVQHVNRRIIKIRQISMQLQNLFAHHNKECNSDKVLLKYLRSNHSHKEKNEIKSYKTSSIRNTYIIEILKVLVKSTAKNDPSVIPEILNILAMILEDNTMNIFKDKNKQSNDVNDAAFDTYDDLMNFMKSIALPLNDNEDDANIISISNANNHNQCVRVMIAVSIARGSLFDMLSIVKMLLSPKLNQEEQRKYDVFKILNKLHAKKYNMMNYNENDEDSKFHPLQSINKYAPYLLNHGNNNNNDDESLSGLQLCVVLLSELELIALHHENHESFKSATENNKSSNSIKCKLNKESLNAPLHIDCSLKVLKVLNEIISVSSYRLQHSSSTIASSDLDLIHRILFHTLKLLTVQVSAMDRLRITIDNFCIPNYQIKELKCILLHIIRSTPNVPRQIIAAAAKTLVKGQKLFFVTVNTKLIYLLALLIRQQEIEQNDGECSEKNIKLKKFLHDFSDDLVDPLSSITMTEIEVSLPFMLNQFGSVGQPSKFIDSLLSNHRNKTRDDNADDDHDDHKKDDNQSRKLFFGTLEMLVSNCWIDINHLDETHNHRMSELLLDLQSMLLFRYQSKFEHGVQKSCQFSDSMPISLQEIWHNLHQNPSAYHFETRQQQNIDECLFQYAKHVLSTSMQILQDISNTGTDQKYLSFIFEHDCDILHRSFFGKITIPLLTHLLQIIESTSKDTQKQKIFKHLMRNKLYNNLLTPHFSNLLKLADEILTRSKNFSEDKLRKAYKIVYERRESPHPYPAGKIIKQLVTIPGANEMLITFDKTVCCTSSKRDYLRIFTKTCNGFVPVTSTIYGSSNKWPNKIVVPGDCVLIYFSSKSLIEKIGDDDEESEEHQTEYGYKLCVQAEILVDHMQKVRWIEDVSCLLIKFHTIIASSFIDPGHLGVSFDALLPFPLLLLGGYYPYKVSLDESHLYLPQTKSWRKIKNAQKSYEEYDDLLRKIYNFKECKQDNDDLDYKSSEAQDEETTLALKRIMDELLICTSRSYILLFEETQITRDIVAHLHCAIFAVLLRHTGIISQFVQYMKLSDAKCKKNRRTNKGYNEIPRELQALWERARVGVTQIVDDVASEQVLMEKQLYFIARSDLLMKLSPAFLHIPEALGSFDTSKLVVHCEGYLSPVEKQSPWICNVCFHFNDSQQFQCQICESERHKNKTQGINVRFTWSKNNFPSDELYKSFQSVCCVENIIRSQRHTTHKQNYYTVAPVKKLAKQIISFITKNKTSVDVFAKLLTTQSTLGLFRIKGLHIIYDNIVSLSYAQNITQFAEHLANLMTLSNIQSVSSTSTLNLTESKQIEKSVANLKLSSIHSGGFAHILSNIECCGYGISSEIITVFHNILHFLLNQSQKCNNHQLGFTTPLFHLIGTLIRTQDLAFVAASNIIPYLKDFVSLNSLNSCNPTKISFQQRFAAWTAFRTCIYSTAFPMFSSLPTISVDSPNTTSPPSNYFTMFPEKIEKYRFQVFHSVIKAVVDELKTLYNAQKNHKINQFKDEDLKEILLKLQQVPRTHIRDEDNKASGNHIKAPLECKSKWSCGVCTFVNKKEDDTCAMCFRGVRPTFIHDHNECNNIKVYTFCLKCGAAMSPHAANTKCVLCGAIHDDTSPLTYIYNEKLQISKWVDRLRQQSICNSDMQYLYLLQQDIGWLPINNNSGNHNVHSLAAVFGINQLLWLLLRCCPCKEFLITLQQNNDIVSLILGIVMNKKKINNLSPISKILAIKVLIWLLPTMNPHAINGKSFLENALQTIGKSDYYSWQTLTQCFIKKEEQRIANNVCLELLYLIRVLFQHNAWTEMIENICVRILSVPFHKCDDVTMNSPTPQSSTKSQPRSRNSSTKSTPSKSSAASIEEVSAASVDDDDEKFELCGIEELAETPYNTPFKQRFPKRRLFFEQKDEKDEKSEFIYENNSKTFVSFNILNHEKCADILQKIVGVLCVMGEFMAPLHEGLRVKVKHRDKEFTGTVIKIKYEDPSDLTGEFTEIQVLCDNGLNLSINMTNKEQFEISILDNTPFNPLKLRKPKYLLLLLRSYIHETFISPQSSESSFCKTILRRVISVIRQFSRYNEFALVIQHFGLIKDLVAVSLEPLQKFEEHFDAGFDEENIWKYNSRSKNHAQWRKNLKIGSIIDCEDRLTKWFESEIVQFDYNENKLLIHYCEWSSKWDEWLSLDSERLAPWRTHTDGSFKNRGYNPFSSAERHRMNLKLRNPNKNIKMLQKCILGLNKFNKLKCDAADTEIEQQLTKLIKHHEADENDENDEHTEHDDNDNDDDDNDNEDDDDEDDEDDEDDNDDNDDNDNYAFENDVRENEENDNNDINAPKAGIPCANHIYLANTNINQSKQWNDVICNESLEIIEAKHSLASDKSFVLNGKCKIYNEFKANPAPTNHIPNDYEFRGSTFFISIVVPRNMQINDENDVLFEWNIDKVIKFKIGFKGNRLVIRDGLNKIYESAISFSSAKTKEIMIMISLIKTQYAIYLFNCEKSQFLKTISFPSVDFAGNCRMSLKITKNNDNKSDGIAIRRMAIWRWIGLDFNAFCYLSQWKDSFIESLQHLNPSQDCIIFEKNFNRNNKAAAEDNEKADKIESKLPLFRSPPKVFADDQNNANHCGFAVINIPKSNGDKLAQYSIILSFTLTKDKMKHAINLLQIPDNLSLSILERDSWMNSNIGNMHKDKSITQTPQRQKSITPNVEEISHSVVRHIIGERHNARRYKLSHKKKKFKASPDVAMIWIDKKRFIWICDEKTNTKISINEQHVILLCVHLKKRYLSLMLDTNEIYSMKINTANKYKWRRNLKPNSAWCLCRKLVCGGLIDPINGAPSKANQLMIEKITIKPKCCSVKEAVSLALTCFFHNDPLSDLLGNLGFNVHQIKFSKKWKATFNKNDEWLDILLKMTEKYQQSNYKKKYNVKIQFKKKYHEIAAAAVKSTKKIGLHAKDNNNTKHYLHICASTQLDSISPEEIRWKLYKKSIYFNNEIHDDEGDDDDEYNYDETKRNVLLCSHWIYCQIPSEMQQKQLLAKRLCYFTSWNKEKTSNVLQLSNIDNSLDEQSCYHLVEIMYKHEMQQTVSKFSGNLCHEEIEEKKEKQSDDELTFDELFVHMFDEWSKFEKHHQKMQEGRCGTQICDSSNGTVYDTCDRIYQELINDRWKFHSHRGLYLYKEIGNYQHIKKKAFDNLSEIIESNLSSLYARDSILSFLDEYSCYDDNLLGLLPSINFHQAFDNISDNENLVKFLELVFEEETFARINVLEKALQTGIEQELDAFDTQLFHHKLDNSKEHQYRCPIINALMNTILSQLLQYFDAIYVKNNGKNNKNQSENKQQDHENDDDDDHNKNKVFVFKNGQNINIEFALWLVSIFVTILTDIDTLNKKKELKYKMLVLVFNNTLMSLLFDCVVIAPTNIGIKVTWMLSKIIEMYPKKHPLQDLKKKLFTAANLCNDINKNSKHSKEEEEDDDYDGLYITVKHVGVLANVLQDMHQKVEVPNDLTIALTQLMLSITSCNYHHAYAIDLSSMSWFQSVYSTYTALKWFSLKKEKRTTSSLQFLSPTFYSKLYDSICSWNQVKKKQVARRNISFVNILQNNIKQCSDLLNEFHKLLQLPLNILCKERSLNELKRNLKQFCDICVALGVDKLAEIEEIINLNINNIESEADAAANHDPDWLILQQIKQICSKLYDALNVLYCEIFADTDNINMNNDNLVDECIEYLSCSFDSTICNLVEKAIEEFEVKDILNNDYDFGEYKISKENAQMQLKKMDDLYIASRMQSIYNLNQLIMQNVHYFDLTHNQNVLCDSKHLILNDVSVDCVLQRSLEQTQDGQANEPSFQVDRFRCKCSEEPDYLMFTECMKQLHSFKPDTFRLEAYSKAWKCQFAKEHATDAGGPYRESIEWMMNEVQCNQHLGLFMLCPNGKNKNGLNRDKYVPAPNKCSYQDEKMYIFLGKLMGLAMRTKELLPLNIAPAIWKRICNDKITVNDILSIDINAFSIFKHLDPFIQILDVYRKEIDNYDYLDEVNCNLNYNNAEINEMIAQTQIFNSLMVRTRSKFQGKSSDGNTYQLIPNGELIPITHKNVKHYKTAFINFRLKEYDFVCDAIRRGLSTVVPIHILNILSWKKVEELICGQSVIDIDLFKQMTTYSNCSLNDRTIQLFWDVIKHKMNNFQRSKLLQFVWGRSRLPANKTDFDKKMSILLLDHHQNNPNDYLPVSHTCFFQLDLPKYTNADVMYEKIVYAIMHCGSIDTDE